MNISDGPSSAILQKVEIPIITNEECELPQLEMMIIYLETIALNVESGMDMQMTYTAATKDEKLIMKCNNMNQ